MLLLALAIAELIESTRNISHTGPSVDVTICFIVHPLHKCFINSNGIFFFKQNYHRARGIDSIG